MSLLRSLCIAISMYSRIPAPWSSEWKKEDGRFAVAFFPVVGVIIGLCTFGWLCLWTQIANRHASALVSSPALGVNSVMPSLALGANSAMPSLALGANSAMPSLALGANSAMPSLALGANSVMPSLALVLTSCIIPLLITGGIHLDGFMDTSDARHSYGSREKKLEILNDPHIGAFAVIRTIILCAIFVSAVDVILHWASPGRITVFCLIYILSRALSGIAVLTFKGAKKQGMLQNLRETTAPSQRVNLAVLLLEAAAAAAVMLAIDPAAGAAVVAAALAVMLHYYKVAMREFGGTTGDLAGWFLCRCEAAMAAALALVCVFF